MIVLLIANLVLTTVGLLYLAWSLQGVWDIITRMELDKPNTIETQNAGSDAAASSQSKRLKADRMEAK